MVILWPRRRVEHYVDIVERCKWAESVNGTLRYVELERPNENDSEIIGHDWEDQRWETFRRDFRINVMMFNPDTCACAPLLWCVMRS